jgi:sulfatase maturation enzyme AslB (radical SAM superfamily)
MHRRMHCPPYESSSTAVRAAVPRGVRVVLAIQTNGTLLTREFIPVLREHGVSVAFSLDGDEDTNDLHRLDRRGRSTHARTMDAISLLREELDEAYSGVLAVVDLRADPQATYRFLAGLRPPLLDFNLPHATHAAPPKRHGAAPAYGRWLAEVFDAWAEGDHYHSIRFFDHVIALSMGARNSVEYLGLAEVDLIVVEADGAIEGVDALKASYDGAPDLGLNIFEHDFDDALAAPAVARRQTGREELASSCQSCDLVSVCGGGYLPHRWSPTAGFDNPSVYCDDLAYVIRHIRDRVGFS